MIITIVAKTSLILLIIAAGTTIYIADLWRDSCWNAIGHELIVITLMECIAVKMAENMRFGLFSWVAVAVPLLLALLSVFSIKRKRRKFEARCGFNSKQGVNPSRTSQILFNRKEKSMKKKEWYELLDEYNRLVEEKKFNEKAFDKETYFEIREKITHYLNVAYDKAAFDAKEHWLSLCNKEPNPLIVEHRHSKSRSVSWMKKADKIFASLEAHQLIDKADMEDSYYDTSIFSDLVKMWPYMALIVAAVVVLALML